MASSPAPPTAGIALAPGQRSALEAGRLAPSAHNSQPWRFGAVAGGIEVAWDERRELSAGDPHGHYLFTSLGAAAESISVGAAGEQMGGCVHPALDRARRCAAFVELGSGPPAQADEALAPALVHRCTTRLPFRPEAVPNDAIHHLAGEVASVGAALHVLVDAGRRERFADLVGEGTARNFSDPDVYGEFFGWLRFEPSDPAYHRDGLTGQALGFGPASSARSAVAGWAMDPTHMQVAVSTRLHRLMAGTQRRLAHRSAAVALLTVPGHDPEHLFGGGRALLRMWLAATKLGLKVHPMTAAVDHQETRVALAHLFGLPTDVAMVACVRLGFASSTTGPRSPRLPLAELLSH